VNASRIATGECETALEFEVHETCRSPLELILARNLLSSVSTPAFLVGEQGLLLFYNEAAGALLGRRFEDTGTMTAEEWTREFGPFGADESRSPTTRTRPRLRAGEQAVPRDFRIAAPVVATTTSPRARSRLWVPEARVAVS